MLEMYWHYFQFTIFTFRVFSFIIFTLIQLLYLGVSNHLSWVTARLISALFPPVLWGWTPNSASETLLVITHTVKKCSILKLILCDLFVYISVQTRQKTNRWPRIVDENKDVLYNMFDYIMIGFSRMWQTFKLLSWPSIVSLACSNMLFFKECTCCLIVSLIFFSESFPLNPAASAIKQRNHVNYISCTMLTM